MSSSRRKELVEIRGLNSSYGYFSEKEFLSIEEVYHSLPKEGINTAGKHMKSNIERTRSDISLRLPVEFSITGLQHCTDLMSTRKILESQSFKGREHDRSRTEFMNLSFWAANVSPAQRTRARKEAYTHVQTHVPQDKAEEYKGEIRQQITNSPAFNQRASRYGNFRFALPFTALLSLYKLQFCKDEEPELSILGTDVYKQEVVHYVVVHSPDNTRFKDHPRVPRLQTRCDPLPSVFLLGDTLYWRPESTSNALKVLTKDGHLTACNQPNLCDQYKSSGHCCHKVPCAWNHLVIAFHIPQGNVFKIDRDKLINKLSACEAIERFTKRFMKDSRMTKTEAKTQVDALKRQYVGRSQKLQPKVDSSHGERFGRRADRMPLTERNIQVERRERRTEAKRKVKRQHCRAPNTENEEVTITQMDTSTQQPCPLSTHVRVKQERTGGSGTGKQAADKESKRRSSHQKPSLRTDYPKISKYFESRPVVPAEVKVGEQPSTHVQVKQEKNGGSGTGKHGADKRNKRGGPHQKPSLITDYPKISSFFGPRPRVPAEEVEVGEQPSTHVLVKQEKTGGSVTGKHGAKRERRGDPRENGENIEQCGPPLKKNKK